MKVIKKGFCVDDSMVEKELNITKGDFQPEIDHSIKEIIDKSFSEFNPWECEESTCDDIIKKLKETISKKLEDDLVNKISERNISSSDARKILELNKLFIRIEEPILQLSISESLLTSVICNAFGLEKGSEFAYKLDKFVLDYFEENSDEEESDLNRPK